MGPTCATTDVITLDRQAGVHERHEFAIFGHGVVKTLWHGGLTVKRIADTLVLELLHTELVRYHTRVSN